MGKQILFPGLLDVDSTTLADLTAGQTGILDLSDASCTNALPTDASVKFQIATKDSTLGLVLSVPFCQNDVKKAYQVNYSAGTAQVVTITPVLPSSQARGDEFIVKVIDTTPGTANLKTKSFSVYHEGTDYTVATLIDAFVALIGTDADLKVTAADGTTVMTLTATTPDNHFRVAVSGSMQDSTIAYTTPNVPSFGTEAKVKALEEELKSFDKGVLNKVLFTREPAYQASGTYDITILELEIPTSDKSGRGALMIEKQTIYICEASAGANPVGSLFTS